MKKLTSVLFALGLLITASSFTPSKDDTVSAKVKSAFEKTFIAASDVAWKKVNGFYMVNFKINEQDCSAAYNEEGELMSATRILASSQLPLNISLALQNKYADYAIDKSVREITVENETVYYIKADNSKQSLSIKANSAGALSIENKVKK
ncbi:MAG: hypothetical protein ABIO55_10455 [Ginsengibacter sp.]